MNEFKNLDELRWLMKNKLIPGHESTLLSAINAGDAIVHEVEQLRKDKAELVLGLMLSRKSIFKACNNAVDRLNEIAPNEGWDSGDTVALMHCVGLDLLLAKHTKPKGEG